MLNYNFINNNTNDKKRKYEDDLYFGINAFEEDFDTKKICLGEETIKNVMPLEFSFEELIFKEELDQSDSNNNDLSDLNEISSEFENSLLTEILSPESSPQSSLEKELHQNNNSISSFDISSIIFDNPNFNNFPFQFMHPMSIPMHPYIPIDTSIPNNAFIFSHIPKFQMAYNTCYPNNEVKLLHSSPPRNPLEENLLIESTHKIYDHDCLVCYYCGNIFKKRDKLKDIHSHMRDCCKKKGKMLIPVFQFRDSEGNIKNAFIRDSFEIGLEDKLFKRIRNKFKNKLKSNVLALIEPKHPLFSKLPKTFKNPTNNKVVVYEFDRFICNLTDDILFGRSYSFVNTHFLLD